ncbi:hypothetical protein [Candidatus Hodarchaeum mangrovi]
MGTHRVISLIEEIFGGIELHACFSLVDSEGLVLYSTGDCLDQMLLEGLNAQLIVAFESTLKAFQDIPFSNSSLDYILINSGDIMFYVDDLAGDLGLFLIIRTRTDLMERVLPFLKSFVKTVEKNLTKSR